MPIKPENRHRYPADWPAIRERILSRAKWRCEHVGCGARQYAVGHWQQVPAMALPPEFGAATGRVWQWVPAYGNAMHDLAGEGLDYPSCEPFTYEQARQFAAESFEANPSLPKPIVIVLTVAHLDHTPENCSDDNLRAWCQRHHLNYDRIHHQVNAHATRRARAGTADLFDSTR